MTEFNFDESKKFTENKTEFLESIKDIDPEMAEIFADNIDKLIAVVRGGERDTKARSAFNESIASVLDELLEQVPNEEGE